MEISDGREHARISVALAPIAILLGYFLGDLLWLALGDKMDWTLFAPLVMALGAGLGCIGSVVISPDLDLVSLTHSEYVVLDIPVLGWVLGPLFIAYWLPYAMLFGRGHHRLLKHRGLSHWPVLGTLTRVAWLAPAWGFPFWKWPGIWPYWALVLSSLILGLMIGDIGHWIRDFRGWRI
jgi:uncharacterized metal-binding protein